MSVTASSKEFLDIQCGFTLKRVRDMTRTYSQVCLYSINHNEMKMKMKMKNRSHGYDINRPRPRHGHKYSKYKVSHYHDA